MFVHWNPILQPADSRESLDASLIDFFTGMAESWPEPSVARVASRGPRVHEADDGFEILLDAPGVKHSDVDLTLEGSQLTIRVERRIETPEGYRPLLTERVGGATAHRVRLGRDVDTEDVRARLENGVLSIRLPKAERAKPRRIEVKSDH